MSHRDSSTIRHLHRVAHGTALGAFCVTANVATAQDGAAARHSTFELRPFVGAFLPTGEQRDLLRDAFLVGAQGSYRTTPRFAFTGTLAWTPSKDRRTPGDQALDMYHYDVGVEGRAPSWLGGAGWDVTPFAGLGLGGRTYDYRDLDVDARTQFAGYGALGAELGLGLAGRVGARFEARDYVSRFAPLTGRGDAEARNDVTLSLGLTVRF
jgi:hypothetical protein